MSFDEWWRGYSGENRLPENTFIKLAYEAGAQSRQAEIDELNFKLVEMKSRLNDAYTDGQTSMYKTKQAEIDELRTRIDRVVHILTYTNHASTPLCNELRDILKGE